MGEARVVGVDVLLDVSAAAAEQPTLRPHQRWSDVDNVIVEPGRSLVLVLRRIGRRADGDRAVARDAGFRRLGPHEAVRAVVQLDDASTQLLADHPISTLFQELHQEGGASATRGDAASAARARIDLRLARGSAMGVACAIQKNERRAGAARRL